MLLDWSFTGDGAVGEDVANLIIDSCADGLMDVALLPEIADSVTRGYLNGLHDGGWTGSSDAVRATTDRAQEGVMFGGQGSRLDSFGQSSVIAWSTSARLSPSRFHGFLHRAAASALRWLTGQPPCRKTGALLLPPDRMAVAAERCSEYTALSIGCRARLTFLTILGVIARFTARPGCMARRTLRGMNNLERKPTLDAPVRASTHWFLTHPRSVPTASRRCFHRESFCRLPPHRTRHDLICGNTHRARNSFLHC